MWHGARWHAACRELVATLSVAVLVMSAPGLSAPAESPQVSLSADATALVMCGTTCPQPDQYWLDAVENQFIAPTHPGSDIDYVAVRTPEEYWPIGGLFRVVGTAVGDQQVWRAGGPGWPDAPWWKLTGLFDLTIDQSLEAGIADLEKAMAEHGNDNLIIYGYSQSAAIAIREKTKLAQQFPAGTAAPDIRFVIGGDTNLPNGGLNSRFRGLYIPILDLTFNGPEPTDTQFHTDVITIQYDGAADFPLYPLNFVATLNALLGFVYLHPNPFDVTLGPDASTSAALQGTHGDSSYYFFETENLPLFAPLRGLGVPEALIDIVEPFFRVLVELGYDRSIPPWKPTPARLFPVIDPVKVTADVVDAVREGIDHAAALVTPPSPSPAATEAPPQQTATDIPQADTPTQSAAVEHADEADIAPTADDAEPSNTRKSIVAKPQSPESDEVTLDDGQQVEPAATKTEAAEAKTETAAAPSASETSSTDE